MAYTIQAERAGQPVMETRNSPASAVVLAMKWTEHGFQAVQIVSTEGRTHDVKSARQRLARGLRL